MIMVDVAPSYQTEVQALCRIYRIGAPAEQIVEKLTIFNTHDHIFLSRKKSKQIPIMTGNVATVKREISKTVTKAPADLTLIRGTDECVGWFTTIKDKIQR